MKKIIGPAGLMVHGIHKNNQKPLSQGSISSKNFEKIIIKLKKRIINADDWIDKVKKKKLGKNDLCITLDDNLRSQVKYGIPILKKHNIKAFFFMYTSVYVKKNYEFEVFRYFYNSRYPSFESFFNDFLNFLMNTNYKNKINKINKNILLNYLSRYKFYSNADKYFRYLRDELFSPSEFKKLCNQFMKKKEFNYKSSKIFQKIWITKKEIKKISDYGHHVGLHSYEHNKNIYKMKYIDQMHQYKKNYDDIKKITGISPESASYPFNSHNKDSKLILKKLNINHVFLARYKILVKNNFEINRLDIKEL